MLIDIDNLSKRFGVFEAVRGISFQVPRGEVLGFLGPNGAGKSTTMKMLAGYLAPSGGRASICGFDVVTSGLEAKRRLGYLPEGAPSYPDMTVVAYLRFIAGIRRLDRASAGKAIAAAVERVDLGAVLEQPIETLSKGFKRRVGLAQAILHDPPVLVLDEPTDGLDPNQKFQVRTLIRAMAHDKAIIVSTHILEEVEALCSRALIIARGEILADGTPLALEARSRYHGAVYLRLDTDLPAPARTILAAVPGVASIEPAERAGDPGVILVPMPGRDILDAVRTAALREQLPVAEIRVERGRLDELFRTVTTGGRA